MQFVNVLFFSSLTQKQFFLGPSLHLHGHFLNGYLFCFVIVLLLFCFASYDLVWSATTETKIYIRYGKCNMYTGEDYLPYHTFKRKQSNNWSPVLDWNTNLHFTYYHWHLDTELLFIVFSLITAFKNPVLFICIFTLSQCSGKLSLIK